MTSSTYADAWKEPHINIQVIVRSLLDSFDVDGPEDKHR